MVHFKYSFLVWQRGGFSRTRLRRGKNAINRHNLSQRCVAAITITPTTPAPSHLPLSNAILTPLPSVQSLFSAKSFVVVHRGVGGKTRNGQPEYSVFFFPRQTSAFQSGRGGGRGGKSTVINEIYNDSQVVGGGAGAVAVVKETRVKHTAAAQRVC